MWFVKFYAPWCGHCKALESDWAQLAERWRVGVVVARLDGTENPVTMDRFDQHVRGFPTLFLFRDRGVYTFDGPRVVDAMETFALESYASAVGKARRSRAHRVRAVLQPQYQNARRGDHARARRRGDGDEDRARGLRQGCGGVEEGWVRIRVVDGADAAAAASPVYGFALVMFSATVICFIMGLALTTAPTQRPVTNAKKTN